MKKKSYIKPDMKVSVIEAETLMAGSMNSTTDSKPSKDDNANQFSKENTFSSPSVWQDDEDED